MTFIRIALTDWEAVFYMVKWLATGLVIGVITMMIIHYRKERKK